MNIRSSFSLLLFALVAIGTSHVNAQTYTLGFDQAEYNVDPGATIDVTLVLTEEITGGETSRLDTAGSGLFAFGLGVDYSAFTGAARGSAFDSLIFNAEFLQNDPDFTKIEDDTVNSIVSFETSETSGAGINGTSLSANLFELDLATLTFTAGDAASITTLQIGNGQSPITNPPIFFADGSTPDVAFGSGQIIVSAVPEPGSAAILAVFACAGLMTRRRK
jgi:hypothetical protein